MTSEKSRKIKRIAIECAVVILVQIILILILLFFIPVKFPIDENDIEKDREYYMVTFVSEYSTDSGPYIIDEDGEWHYVELKGNDPRNDLDDSITANTVFVIYGSLDRYSYMVDMETYTRTVLECDDWEIYNEIGVDTHKYYVAFGDLKCVQRLFEIIFGGI